MAPVTLTPVPPGELAAIVTYLETRTRPELGALPASSLELTRLVAPDLARYRALFRRVGAPWLWFSRLVLEDEALAAIVHDEDVEVFAVVDGDEQVGLLELDFRVIGECALAYMALMPELTGRGHGRWLLARALDLAWRREIAMVRVHTCTLDHPAALLTYRRAGFVETGRAIETFPDPRAIGVLDSGDAPQVALLAPDPPASLR